MAMLSTSSGGKPENHNPNRGVIIAAIIGAVGAIMVALVPIIAATGSASDSTPTRTTSLTGPATTSTPPGPTSTAPVPGDPVTLTVDKDAVNQEVTVSAVVHEAPTEGHTYWLLLTVHFTKSDVEYYTRWKLKPTVGIQQHTVLTFIHGTDLTKPRTVQVLSVGASASHALQVQLDTDPVLANTLPSLPCSGCDVSKAVRVTPL